MKKSLLLFLIGLISSVASAQIDITQPSNQQICSSFGTYGIFDLTPQTAVILGSLTASEYTVTYHTSLANANADTSPVASPSTFNGSHNQVIHVRVEENANPTNYVVTNFTLIVNPAPTVYEQNYTSCDFLGNPTDGIGIVDLEQVAEQVYQFSSIFPTEMEVVFYGSLTDAQNQQNPLDSPYTNTSVGQAIYARCMYYSNSCATIIPITLLYDDCTGLCLPPDNLTVSNIVGSGATFSWTPVGTETEWELLVLYEGGPFPLPTMDGVIVTTNPANLTGLECPEAFDVYVRARCGSDISDWSDRVTFSTQNCDGGGQPINLEQCADSGNACFDLTVNDANVLGGQNPADFTITYHTTSADANTGNNPIVTPTAYCITTGTATLYVRVFNNSDSLYQVLNFSITAALVVSGTIPLQPLIQCDEDADGTVIFDITTAAGQLGTTNEIAYYTSMANALASTSPIATPSAFSVSTATPLVTIYIRETVGTGCDIIHTVQVNAVASCNLSNVCAGANSLCNALGVPFPNATNIESAEPGNDYGCLDETPNPTWFYLPVSAAGTINLIVEQGSDVNITFADLDADFICYGPFTSPTAPCSGGLTADKIVDCSYSGSLVEYPVIPNAQPGEFYLLMVTNYTQESGYIRISETGSSQGEIDCTGLRLNAFLDANTNGVKDSGEANFTLGQFHYERNDDDVVHNITAPTGIHRIYDLNAANTYDLDYTIDPAYTDFYSLATASYQNVSVVAGAGLQDYNFPVTVLQSYSDVGVTIVSEEAPRPGFTYTNTIVYTNLGSETVASGTVTFAKDAMLTILTNSQTGAVDTADGFSYTFSNLLPFESRSIVVTMQVPLIPAIDLGDLLTNVASVTPLAGDASPQNNAYELTETVIGSWDPNDKMESHGEQILFSDFTAQDYLYYTIRFENTGTASAINIRITDILDEQLDETTVSMIRASHDYTLDRVDNQLTWKFDNVLLPPTIEDPIGSHGFVQFKVKPKAGFALGDVIPNTASIYFDFNPAIVTNTFLTRFVSILAVDQFDRDNFAIYPNPASDVVSVDLRNHRGTLKSIVVWDVSGKVVLTSDVAAATRIHRFSVGDLSAGIYFVEAIADDNTKVIRKLIVN